MSHNGKLLTQIMNNLDRKPRKVRTPDNQWQRPGQVTTVNSPNITMEGVGFDAIGVDVNGYKQYMQDGNNYQFTGPVTEYPLMQVDSNYEKGGEMIRRADGSYSRRGLWDNIRANRGSGKKPTKEMLEQEAKIRATKKAMYGMEIPLQFQNNYMKRYQSGGGPALADATYVKKPVIPNKMPMEPEVIADWAGDPDTVGLVDYLDLSGFDYSKANRAKIAQYMGVKNYNFSAKKNNELLKVIKKYPEVMNRMRHTLVGGPDDEFMMDGHVVVINKYGGEKMPPEIARARFAAAGNLDKMDNYGYAFGGYIPQMMHGGYGYMADGGEPNGEMAMGQMAAVQDKMNKLRQFVQPDQNLDPWIASKLAVMDHSADAIYDYMMYGPEGQGGEEQMPEMANGGYTVTRSNDRKGKTHKVTGPDGTVKYFGDSKLGQHPKDPERKAAFYARHKKNLDRNPYFRAFARATWEDGGQIEEIANIDRLQKREDRLVAKGYKAVDEGRENKADRILGRAARVEDRKIRLMNNMAYGGGIYYQPGGPVISNPADATYVKKPFVPQQYGINPADEYVFDGIDPESVTSVVDYLDLLGMDYSKKNRAEIAKQMGVKNYDYSAKKNNELLNLIKNNGIKVGNMPYSFVGNKNPYYQSGGSIVDYLVSKGMAYDKASRAGLAKKYGVDNYDYSAEKNLELLGVLRNQMDNAGSQVKDPVNPGKPTASVKQSSKYGPLPGSPNNVGFDPYASPSKDRRNLESGTIVDKGTNTMYIINKGKVVKSAPVLTGQAGRNGKKDPNMNPYSVAYLENNPGNRSTPTGTYFMKPNANIYGWPGFNLQPINAYGEQAPNAKNTAIHITYGANAKPGLQGHPDPAEFKRRNAAYTNNPADRYRSYGCTNAQGQTIDCLQTQFPQGDTAIYVDSRNPIDMKYINSVKRKKNGGYVGNDGKRHVSDTPTWSGFAGYEMGGYIPEFMGGGYCYECGGMYANGGQLPQAGNGWMVPAAIGALALGTTMWANNKRKEIGQTMIPMMTGAGGMGAMTGSGGIEALAGAFKQGGMVGQEMDVTPEQAAYLRSQGYQFEII